MDICNDVIKRKSKENRSMVIGLLPHYSVNVIIEIIRI